MDSDKSVFFKINYKNNVYKVKRIVIFFKKKPDISF